MGKSISLSEKVSASSTQTLETDQLSEDAQLEKCTIRFYPGAELDLHIVPLLIKRNGVTTELINTHGKGYIDGDDDYFVFKPDIDLIKGDKIRIHATNQSGSVDLDYRFNIDLKYNSWW